MTHDQIEILYLLLRWIVYLLGALTAGGALLATGALLKAWLFGGDVRAVWEIIKAEI